MLDDLGGRIGRLWREAGEDDTDRVVLIRHLLEGQYANPIRIVAFNTAQSWSRDVTEEIARDLWKCCGDQGEVPRSLLVFLDHHGR